MYTKDKSNRITLRLNDEQFSFVAEGAKVMGVSPSDYLRMIINFSMVQYQKAQKESERRENEQTNIDDKL